MPNEKQIVNLLLSLGFAPHFKGYTYTIDALKTIQRCPKILMQGITTHLYPEIAAKNESTPSRVERSIRHAIETAYSTCSPAWKEYFRFAVDTDKPTNMEFLATVAEVIRVGMVA